MENQKKVIFSVENNHITPYPYKPIMEGSLQPQYAGYYQNEHGEQWIFLYDKEYGGGILIGGDADWVITPLGNGAMPVFDPFLLNKNEQLWLQACWQASSHLREASEGFPTDVITLAIAACLWGIRESTLKKHATDGQLKAKKMGNLWITNTSAMIESYGIPDPKKRFNDEVCEEVEENKKQNTEEIRKKLSPA